MKKHTKKRFNLYTGEIFSQDLFTRISQMRQGDFFRKTESFFSSPKCWSRDRELRNPLRNINNIMNQRKFLHSMDAHTETSRQAYRRLHADLSARIGIDLIKTVINMRVPIAGYTTTQMIINLNQHEISLGLAPTNFSTRWPELYSNPLNPITQQTEAVALDQLINAEEFEYQQEGLNIPLASGIYRTVENLNNRQLEFDKIELAHEIVKLESIIKNNHHDILNPILKDHLGMTDFSCLVIANSLAETGCSLSKVLALLMYCKYMYSFAHFGLAIYAITFKKKQDK